MRGRRTVGVGRRMCGEENMTDARLVALTLSREKEQESEGGEGSENRDAKETDRKNVATWPQLDFVVLLSFVFAFVQQINSENETKFGRMKDFRCRREDLLSRVSTQYKRTSNPNRRHRIPRPSQASPPSCPPPSCQVRCCHRRPPRRRRRPSSPPSCRVR